MQVFIKKYLVTAVLIILAVVVVLTMYGDYVSNPWTRDGQVQAQVVQIASRVSGPIVNLPVDDNSLVRKGDVLWEIDARTYQADLDQAQAQLQASKAKRDDAQSEEQRARRVRKKNPGAISEEGLNNRVNALRVAEADVALAEAELENAKLNLEFCVVKAPVDGYVTNLRLRLGTQAVANQAAIALVDVNSYWVYGFFRENTIADMGPGDQAVITLLTYPDQPIAGTVDSLGWGIAQQDGSTGQHLLPSISPTFEWIRLAQRVPVRIHIEELPAGVQLRVGTTASVLVYAGSAGKSSERPLTPVPKILQ
ncbi:MAG: HlyD family secretion protein [Porticoccus sp.]|nr:HlyD family secretion protein [Porticoccus sp.]